MYCFRHRPSAKRLLTEEWITGSAICNIVEQIRCDSHLIYVGMMWIQFSVLIFFIIVVFINVGVLSILQPKFICCSLWGRWYWAQAERRLMRCKYVTHSNKVFDSDWFYQCRYSTLSAQQNKRAYGLLLIWMYYSTLVICCALLLLTAIISM